jgi:hypothetical protein
VAEITRGADNGNAMPDLYAKGRGAALDQALVSRGAF